MLITTHTNWLLAENLLIQNNVLLNGQYSGLRIPQDILLRRSQHEQLFNGSVRFDNSITATGNVFVEYLNGFHSDVLCDLALAPLTGSGLYGLEILGKFASPFSRLSKQSPWQSGLPSINYRVGILQHGTHHRHTKRANIPRSLGQHLVYYRFYYFAVNACDSGTNWVHVWHYHKCKCTQICHQLLIQLIFIALHVFLYCQGTLNGHTIQEIVQNYFSVSRPQVIQSFVTVRGNIVLAGGADIKHLLLEGNLHTGSGYEIESNIIFFTFPHSVQYLQLISVMLLLNLLMLLHAMHRLSLDTCEDCACESLRIFPLMIFVALFCLNTRVHSALPTTRYQKKKYNFWIGRNSFLNIFRFSFDFIYYSFI